MAVTRRLAGVAVIATIAAARLPVTALNVGRAQIALGETTFTELARTLGPAPVASAGDAGDSRREACYRLAGSPVATLYVEGGELGGGDRIEGFVLVARGAASVAEEPALTRACTPVALSGADVRTDRGVALGLSRAQVRSRIGAASRHSAGVAIHEADANRRGGGNAFSTLRIRYDARGRVVALAGWHDVSD